VSGLPSSERSWNQHWYAFAISRVFRVGSKQVAFAAELELKDE
jgi:hypothetical protein